MNQHADSFRTTHTGSLPRPPALSDLEAAGQVKAPVGQLVRRQLKTKEGGSLRIIQFSDTHISHLGGAARDASGSSRCRPNRSPNWLRRPC